jgi:Rod binding domain-containing protein
MTTSLSSIAPVNIQKGIEIHKNKPKPINPNTINDRQYIPKQYKEVAESIEAQFAENMLKQMNQTVDENPTEDSGMDYYKSMQTSERAKMMAQQNNLGLQNIILDQIYPKRMRNEMALKQYENQANLIHHNLPSYKLAEKSDRIEIERRKNESSPGTKEREGVSP